MKYPPLIESCKKAIENDWCLGCQALEEPTFVGNPNCKYSKSPTVEESINYIKGKLGIQESFFNG